MLTGVSHINGKMHWHSGLYYVALSLLDLVLQFERLCLKFSFSFNNFKCNFGVKRILRIDSVGTSDRNYMCSTIAQLFDIRFANPGAGTCTIVHFGTWLNV